MVLRTILPGLASFLQLILALEGTMNFPRTSFRGSAASREAAYSRVAAPAGKTGLEGLTGLAPLAMPLEEAMVTDRSDHRERRRRCIYLSIQGCCLVCVAVSQSSIRVWPGPLPAPLPPPAPAGYKLEMRRTRRKQTICIARKDRQKE